LRGDWGVWVRGMRSKDGGCRVIAGGWVAGAGSISAGTRDGCVGSFEGVWRMPGKQFSHHLHRSVPHTSLDPLHHARTHKHTHEQTNKHTHTHTRAQTHACAHAHTCMHPRTHEQAHANTRTSTSTRLRRRTSRLAAMLRLSLNTATTLLLISSAVMAASLSLSKYAKAWWQCRGAGVVGLSLVGGCGRACVSFWGEGRGCLSCGLRVTFEGDGAGSGRSVRWGSRGHQRVFGPR
jgi:hypothetical protein